MPQPITVDNFTAAMEKAVAERGKDYYYREHFDACTYFVVRDGVVTDEPACLIGCALHELGYGPDDLAFDNVGPAVEVLDYLDAPEALLNAAQAAQDAQDSNLPWGTALERYRYKLAKFIERQNLKEKNDRD